jgi:F-type H+-transporting ATPase subunit b
MQLAIDEAAEAKRAAEAKLKEYNDRLAQLDSELAKLRSDLVAAGEEDKKRIVAEAEETAQRMKRETEALIDQHSKQLVTQVRREMVDAAVAASEKLVRERLGASDQQRLADAYRQQVSSKSGRPS